MIARLLLTPGEPAGIGPDLCVLAAQQPFSAELVVAADPVLLHSRAERLGLPLQIEHFDASEIKPHRAGTMRIWPVSLAKKVTCGLLDTNNAPYVIETLQTGIRACQEGRFDALVTGPVHKGNINNAGIAFTGHTELLATVTGVPKVVMMLATDEMRVALATTHIALKDVPAAITPNNLDTTLRVLERELRLRFGIEIPRILVCGLNPHAGESGHLGREELDVIVPVIERLKLEGMLLEGPLPADTLFVPQCLERGDAVLAMYHDQGLPVLKHKGFGQAVNITLGLPFVRTSVDHGTALERAGTGNLHAGSMTMAIAVAIDMVMRGSSPKRVLQSCP